VVNVFFIYESLMNNEEKMMVEMETLGVNMGIKVHYLCNEDLSFVF
jgi:hypothetical protein